MQPTYVEVSDVKLIELLASRGAVNDVLEILRGVSSRDVEHDLRATRMVVHEGSHVVNLRAARPRRAEM